MVLTLSAPEPHSPNINAQLLDQLSKFPPLKSRAWVLFHSLGLFVDEICAKLSAEFPDQGYLEALVVVGYIDEVTEGLESGSPVIQNLESSLRDPAVEAALQQVVDLIKQAAREV